MNEQPSDRTEDRVRDTARGFLYPPTPDIAGGVGTRLVRRGQTSAARAWPLWVAGAVALLLVVLLLAPDVRASVFDTIRIGAIRLLFGATPTPTAMATAPAPSAPVTTVVPEPPATGTASAVPAPASPTPFRNLAGQTTLEGARARVSFPIRLPAYPPDLSPPDQAFVQQLGGTYVVLVWLDPAQPQQARMVLHILGPDVFAEKLQPRIIGRTTVHGQAALWTEGPYMLQFLVGGRPQPSASQLIEGHSLIWSDGNLTYKLESSLSMEEAVRVAESIP